MRQYMRYIIRQLAWSTLAIALSLTSIVWLSQALRFIDYIVNRGVSILMFLHLTLLMVPSLFMIVLPFALLCATLYTYNRLTQDSELVVLQSAGLSRFQVAKPALTMAVYVTLISYAITLYILPLTYSQFKDMQVFLRDNFASLLLQEEVFNSPVDGLTVYIKERDNNGNLRGIIVHDSRDPAHPLTMMAELGKLVQTPQGPRFLLVNGNRQEMSNGHLNLLQFKSYAVDIGFYTSKRRMGARQPEELFPAQLFSYQGDPQMVNEMRAEGHKRLAWPLYDLALVMLAIGILISGEFNRRSQWRRITLAAGAGSVALLVGFGLTNVAARYPMLIALIYLPLLMVCFYGWRVLGSEKPLLRAEG
jgi:lipopolysaccharide export system permease protein